MYMHSFEFKCINYNRFYPVNVSLIFLQTAYMCIHLEFLLWHLILSMAEGICKWRNMSVRAYLII
jgi:hypothetical protein